jgi:hypothetical protein
MPRGACHPRSPEIPRPGPARYLHVMGSRTFALIQAIHATDDRSPAHTRQLYAAHGVTLLA